MKAKKRKIYGQFMLNIIDAKIKSTIFCGFIVFLNLHLQSRLLHLFNCHQFCSISKHAMVGILKHPGFERMKIEKNVSFLSNIIILRSKMYTANPYNDILPEIYE